MWFLSELNGLWGILESKNFRFMLPIILIKLNLDQINNRVCKSVVINKKIRKDKRKWEKTFRKHQRKNSLGILSRAK